MSTARNLAHYNTTAHKPEPFVWPHEADPFDQELYLYNYFRKHFKTNKTKLLLFAERIRPLCPESIQKGFFYNLFCVKDPVGWMKRNFTQMDEFPVVMQDLIDDGNHGMIMDGEEIHGVSIKTNPSWIKSRDDRWAQEQEDEIINEIVLLWMSANRRESFNGRIAMFRQFGFSGCTFGVDKKFSAETMEKLRVIWGKEDLDEIKKYSELRGWVEEPK